MRSVLLRIGLLALLIVLPVWASGDWTGAVGPSATLQVCFDGGAFLLTYEERWTEQPRTSIATGTYHWEGELLELDVASIKFEGYGAENRDPMAGFTIETPRKGVMDNPNPSITLRPKGYIRLRATEDDGLLELRGNGGFEVDLTR